MTEVVAMSQTRKDQLARIGIPEEDIRTDCDVCGHKDSRTILNHSYPYAFKGYLCRTCKDLYRFKTRPDSAPVMRRIMAFTSRSEEEAAHNTGLGPSLPKKREAALDEGRELRGLTELADMYAQQEMFLRRKIEEAQAHLDALPPA